MIWRFRRDKRGQFLIVAAVLISMLVISVAFSSFQLGLYQEKFRYQPAKETVTEITSDLDRALTHSLSIGSMTYNDTGRNSTAWDQAKLVGRNYILQWQRSVVSSHSNLGLQMSIQPTTGGGSGPTDVNYIFEWDSNPGTSNAYAKFNLNVTTYGLTGWTGGDTVSRTLTINNPTFDSDPISNTTSFTFTLVEEKEKPVSNLRANDVTIEMRPYNADWEKAPLKNTQYLGDGEYKVELSKYYWEVGLGKKVTIITPDDKIYVSATVPRPPPATVTLQSQGNSAPPNLGTIIFGDVPYNSLPATVRVSRPPQTFEVIYVPDVSRPYVFQYWTIEGAAEIVYGDSASNPIWVEIRGDAIITAYYGRTVTEPPTTTTTTTESTTITTLETTTTTTTTTNTTTTTTTVPFLGTYFDSINATDEATSHLGVIRVSNSSWAFTMSNTDPAANGTLPWLMNLSVGDYAISFTPPNENNTFLGWQVNDYNLVRVDASNAMTTTLHVSGDGGIVMAIYAPIVIGGPGEYSELFVGEKTGSGLTLMMPMPVSFWPSDTSHGADKAVIDLYMTIPDDARIRFDGPAYYFMQVSQPHNARGATLTIEYRAPGSPTYQVIHQSDLFPISRQGANKPVMYTIFPEHNESNPIDAAWYGPGGDIHVQVIVEYDQQPYGVAHLWYGPMYPSYINISVQTIA